MTFLRAPTRGDVLRARRRCALLLRRFRIPPFEIDPECVISVCVPVYDESTERLQEQILAYARQRFPKRRFELVYVVNNDVPDGSLAQTRAIRSNRRAVRFLRGDHPVTVRVIDCSSSGREIPGCNVGLARNVGLHAIAARYLGQGRDGIIIHTDADTVPTTVGYLRTVWNGMKDDRVLAAAGGLELVLDLDDADPRERAYFRRHIGTLRDYSLWQHLGAALAMKEPTPSVPGTRFSGAHTVVKAVAGVRAGGFPSAVRAEDVLFGERVKDYARAVGKRVLLRRDRWILRTAIRESTRTGISFGPIFDNIKRHRGRPSVRPPGSMPYRVFLDASLVSLKRTRGNKEAIRRLFVGVPSVRHPSVLRTLRRLAHQLGSARGEAGRSRVHDGWMKTSPAPAFLYDAYRAAYPHVPLTKRRLAAFKRQVFRDPKRKASVLEAVKDFSRYKRTPRPRAG